MKSELPKVLVEINSRPMVEYVLDAVRAAGVQRTLVVVGYRGIDVQNALAGREGLEFVEQKEQLGTGHAVNCCRDALAGHDGPVAIVTGDSPLTQADSLSSLFAAQQEESAACVLGTLEKANPHGLGRIVRDDEGQFQAIVEEKDATPKQRAIREVNMSTYVFESRELLHSLALITNDNKQGEYYITDCPGILQREGKKVLALPVLKECEALSVNTPEELELAATALRELEGRQ